MPAGPFPIGGLLAGSCPGRAALSPERDIWRASGLSNAVTSSADLATAASWAPARFLGPP